MRKKHAEIRANEMQDLDNFLSIQAEIRCNYVNSACEGICLICDVNALVCV
jgi:hypothetical protein